MIRPPLRFAPRRTPPPPARIGSPPGPPKSQLRVRPGPPGRPRHPKPRPSPGGEPLRPPPPEGAPPCAGQALGLRPCRHPPQPPPPASTTISRHAACMRKRRAGATPRLASSSLPRGPSGLTDRAFGPDDPPSLHFVPLRLNPRPPRSSPHRCRPRLKPTPARSRSGRHVRESRDSRTWPCGTPLAYATGPPPGSPPSTFT